MARKRHKHSLRDPVAWKGPSHRPDMGRSYKSMKGDVVDGTATRQEGQEGQEGSS